MANLIAQEIKIWDGSKWNNKIYIWNGNDWVSILDGKVNILGNDNNWYKTNSVQATVPSTTFGFTAGKYHIDNNSTNWNLLRNDTTTGNYNSYLLSRSYYSSSYYTILRGIIRFDFTNITINNPITKIKLNLPRATGESNAYVEKIIPYLFNHNSQIQPSDFHNFSTKYATPTDVIMSDNLQVIELNSTAIIDIQTALNNNSMITFMLLTENDSENIVPTTLIYNATIDYLNSTLEIY